MPSRHILENRRADGIGAGVYPCRMAVAPEFSRCRLLLSTGTGTQRVRLARVRLLSGSDRSGLGDRSYPEGEFNALSHGNICDGQRRRRGGFDAETDPFFLRQSPGIWGQSRSTDTQSPVGLDASHPNVSRVLRALLFHHAAGGDIADAVGVAISIEAETWSVDYSTIQLGVSPDTKC